MAVPELAAEEFEAHFPFTAAVLAKQERWALLDGDCLELLQVLPSNSIDAAITDPPAGISFMDLEWDHDKKDPEKWIAWLAERLAQVHRVLKPGGHGLVWALPRTSHRTGRAIDNAGFVIKDRVSHFFGQGFPKGGDISKSIDKALGVKRRVVGPNPNHRAVSGVDYEGVYAGGNTGNAVITAATSPEAQAWEDWAVALKPACEDWWLIQKPFKGATYKNVLKHGTGALNIGACRIATEEKLTRKLGKTTSSDSGWKSVKRSPVAGKDGGRWPANVTLDEEAAAMLDAQTGVLKSGDFLPHHKARASANLSMSGGNQEDRPVATYGDEGGASRFFYVAKAPKKEKNAGLDENLTNIHPTIKALALMRWLCRLITPPNGVILDPFAGSGSTGCAALQEGFRFIGIEQSAEYVEIASQRLTYWEQES